MCSMRHPLRHCSLDAQHAALDYVEMVPGHGHVDLGIYPREVIKDALTLNNCAAGALPSERVHQVIAGAQAFDGYAQASGTGGRPLASVVAGLALTPRFCVAGLTCPPR